MSSTLHFSLLRDPKLLDVIDEEWEKEVLPEDDMILPKNVPPPLDELDELEDAKAPQDDSWTDLGLTNIQ